MGTNYYTYSDDEKCPHCGKGTMWLHIGKSWSGCGYTWAKVIDWANVEGWAAVDWLEVVE